jgi:hypothetical protein
MTLRPRTTWVTKKRNHLAFIEKERWEISKGLWDDEPLTEREPQGHAEAARRNQTRGAMKRWSGRRLLFLGNHKNRRDAAFAIQEETGVPFEKLRNHLIDGLLGPKENQVVSFPCVPESDYTRRQFDVGPKFGIDYDLSAVGPFFD